MLYKKKSLGQHFLHNNEVCAKIAKTLAKVNVESLIEVGPGGGALTSHLYNMYGGKLNLVELDTRFFEELVEKYPQIKQQIFNQNFLKFDLSTFQNPLSIIGNFPYNISSQIVFKVLDNYHIVENMVGMFQKEMAVRIVAPYNNKQYGVISVLTQAFYDAELLFDIAPSNFTPPPKVDSSILKLTRKEEVGIDRKMFFKVVKLAFSSRRKMMRNNFSSLANKEDLQLPIFNKRAEQLQVKDFKELTSYFINLAVE